MIVHCTCCETTMALPHAYIDDEGYTYCTNCKGDDEMKIKISNHSCHDEGIVDRTENISSTIDKMIRLAAKLTERFASDIAYDIEDLKSAVKEKKPLDHLLCFREDGVETRNVETFDVEKYDALMFCCNIIQFWRLTHDPSTTETKLVRVNVRKDGII